MRARSSGATAWLWARADAVESLDYLVVDEAGQMSLAHVLSAGRSARNLILLGDPQQLEQPQKGAHPGRRRSGGAGPVLIFDQFEEIFTICKKDSVRDQLKEELYYLIEEQVPDSLQKRCLENSTISPYMLSQARFRIVLGLKENYLPHLNWFKHRIPSIDRAPYRVPALNGSQAREVLSIYKNFRDIEIQNDILNQLSPRGYQT